MAGGASRTALLQYLSAPETGVLLAHQKQRTGNPLWVLVVLLLPQQLATKTPHCVNCKPESEPIWMWTTCHLVHCPQKEASECSGPVGGTDTGWLAEGVHDLAPSIVAPGNRRSPTI